MDYEPNEFQKMMIKKYPEMEKQFLGKLDKPRTKEEMKKEYERVYGDDI